MEKSGISLSLSLSSSSFTVIPLGPRSSSHPTIGSKKTLTNKINKYLNLISLFLYKTLPRYYEVIIISKEVVKLNKRFYFITGLILYFSLKVGPLSSLLFAELPLKLGLAFKVPWKIGKYSCPL